ncbi:MAG: hypothetical protein IV107_16445 [Paucibacter sp.]|nr:hypothetical protein [Roseateles sp.]
MSRSGYSDECEDQWQNIMFRGRVASATRGKRGQTLLRDLMAALDAMPDKRLIKNGFVADGAFCTLGVLGAQRGVDMSNFIDGDGDSEDGVYCDRRAVAETFDVAKPLVQEIMYENDSCIWDDETRHVLEIVGPVRPFWPEYGSHQRTYYLPDPTAAARRWQYMRAWVAKQIKGPA